MFFLYAEMDDHDDSFRRSMNYKFEEFKDKVTAKNRAEQLDKEGWTVRLFCGDEMPFAGNPVWVKDGVYLKDE